MSAPASISMVFVRGLLRAQASEAELSKHRASITRQQSKRYSAARSRLEDAIWDGQWGLMQDAERCAVEATKRGQLLYCWAGTKADLTT